MQRGLSAIAEFHLLFQRRHIRVFIGKLVVYTKLHGFDFEVVQHMMFCVK